MGTAPAPASDTTPRPAGDPFGRKAPKLDVLLGRSRAGRALLVGVALEGWRPDFAGYFASVAYAASAGELDEALTPGEAYDLVAWDMGGAAWGSLDRWARRIRASLEVEGSLLVLADNRLALRPLVRNPSRILARTVVTGPGLRAALHRAGFEAIEEYTPLPERNGAEEFVSRRNGEIELPSHASRVERSLRRSGLLPLFHDGLACIASGPGGGCRPLLNRLAGSLAAPGEAVDPLDLERFDLRDRGALVLLLRARRSLSRMACRVTTDPATDRVVGRNAEWTARIHGARGISEEVKRSVPQSLGVISLDTATAYMEERIDGIVGWKLAGLPTLEPVLFDGVYAFVRAFNRDTAIRDRLAFGALDRLLPADEKPWLDSETAAALGRLRGAIRERALGEERSIVWAHGDFGYGNVIAHPATGSIRGVIDWDQGRHDPAGVDLLNFLVQRARGMGGLCLPEALARIGAPFVEGGYRAIDPRLDYDALFPTGPAERAELLGWLALRLAERSVQYPSLFERARGEALQVLTWGLDALS